MSTSSAVCAGWMEIPTTSEKKPLGHFDSLAGSTNEATGAAIAALVDEYAGTLYRVAYSVLRNAADAEDAVQETYLRVLRHRDGLAEIRDPRVWLGRVVWDGGVGPEARAQTRAET